MIKRLVLPREIEDEINKNAVAVYPLEGCGVLLGCKENDSVLKVIHLSNATDPERAEKYFEIDPLEFIEVEREAEKDKLEIIGFYHTHPDHPAIPSKEDELHMIPGLVYLIVSVSKEECREIRVYQKERSEEDAAELETGEEAS